MFRRISNTFNTIKLCVRVLKKDKELIFFPIMAAISVLALAFIMWSMGLIDIQETQTQSSSLSDFIPEIILLTITITKDFIAPSLSIALKLIIIPVDPNNN